MSSPCDLHTPDQPKLPIILIQAKEATMIKTKEATMIQAKEATMIKITKKNILVGSDGVETQTEICS